MEYHQSRVKAATLALVFIETLILLGASIITTSCNHNNLEPPTYYPEPSTYRHSTFPLSTSNQWVYADTSFLTVGPDTIWTRLSMAGITGYGGQSSHGGWNFNNIGGLQGGPEGQYSISNDTVYLYTWYNGAFLNPRIAFLPASVITDTVTIVGPWTWTETSVYSLGRSLVTPAGSFDSVYVYECIPGQSERYLTYFRPGSGVICCETYYAGPSDAFVLSDRSVLIAYDLVK